MSTRFLQKRASSRLLPACLSMFLISFVSLAWSLRGDTARVRDVEEVPARQRMKAEGSSDKDDAAAEARKPMDGREASTRPLAADWSDADRDGIPDVAELGSYRDRENFRRWFTAIAELQFYRLSEEWSSEQRDCAGLVRFAWREALRRHDRQWFERMGPEYEMVAPDVDAYALDSHPLGEKLFRTSAVTAQQGEAGRREFSEFADARSLKEYNCVFVGRDRRLARPGDLLFFFQPWVRKFPYHTMIFLGEARNSSEGARDWVVYHTGASDADAGTVKKVRLAVLDQHPDRRWRPVESNRNFLGFYRLKILD